MFKKRRSRSWNCFQTMLQGIVRNLWTFDQWNPKEDPIQNNMKTTEVDPKACPLQKIWKDPPHKIESNPIEGATLATCNGAQWNHNGDPAKCIQSSSEIPRGHPCDMYGSHMVLQCKWVQWKHMGGSPLQNVWKPRKWILLCGAPCKQTDGTLCNPEGNPSKSCAQCMTTIEVNPKGWPPCKQMATLWNPRVPFCKVYGNQLIS